MKRILPLITFLALALWLGTELVVAQSNPGLVFGQVPTAAQWNSYFAAKMDYAIGGIPVASGGTGATTASGARTNLGLGTSATFPTGTSGATIPLLNTANTWSLPQTISQPTGTPPLFITSTTRVSNLNAASSGTSDNANAINSATTAVNTSSATAPSSGQVLTATSSTAATWQTLIFPGTSGSIGGGALGAGACTSGTVSITGATTSMVAVASPNTYPGDGATWSAQVTSSSTVTVYVCATVALTPGASTYNVRVIK